MSHQTKKTKILFLALIIGLAVIFYFIFFNKNTPQNTEVLSNINKHQSAPAKEQTFTVTPSKENKENSVYTDSQYKFSFQYPKDFTVTKFQEGENTDTILVRKKESEDSFQIFISSFDEPGPLTKERVKQDLPNMAIKNPEQRVLKNGAVALIFFSEESSVGETREIWFVYNGYLYQITTYKELDSLVAAIISTWKFAN